MLTREQYAVINEPLSHGQLSDILYDTITKYEAQMKAKDDHIVELNKKVKAKYDEIERLKAIVEEAIRKPMGVEHHSWSDYKMKDKK